VITSKIKVYIPTPNYIQCILLFN